MEQAYLTLNSDFTMSTFSCRQVIMLGGNNSVNMDESCIYQYSLPWLLS